MPDISTQSDEALKKRILKLLKAGEGQVAPRVMAYSLIYRKLAGRRLDSEQDQRLQRLLTELQQTGQIGRYPDIGVAEPPYYAL